MGHSTSTDMDAALAVLDGIRDPSSGKGLAAAGLVQGLVIRDGRAGFMLEVPAAVAQLYAPVRDAAEKALAGLPGIERAQVVLTTASGGAPASKPAPKQSGTGRLNEDPQGRVGPSETAVRPANVKHVIAVASGKGGVGKSTVSVNLACALARMGLAVGLADADIFGPSAPRMLGVSGQPAFADGKLIPFKAHGVEVMSIGFIAEGDSPMIFRGPRASGAVRQMTAGVAWGQTGPLDVLIIDLPPGTGDIHLTVIQSVKLDGVVIVSTPQEVALIDARRAVAMFGKTGTPVLGVVENMAFFPDPVTGAPIHIFGEGGAKAEAAKLGVPLLAQVPIDIPLRQGGDEGRPLTAGDNDSPAAVAFRQAAATLRDAVLR
ncbi:ATP-binding protein involved in chromosome partitioning [Caulobacter ginsengisoli]|uniref:Iron-sulfur cluster carrier protein n=1 Tax=Caulobacter ginsengisoli TaxID=400775 RepID=A0ABU0INS0_9CAUL|nr:Mrp/NBP35 family ATP-binding protein [Caulobacter ginsengisoli]MDQ0463641.1 ATP-binding protein involved in chromosome partitioning [Caulobacter ginsengisoli]